MSVEPRYRNVFIWNEDKIVDITNPFPVSAIITGATVYTVPPYTSTVSLLGDQTDITIATPPVGKKLQAIGCFVTGETALFNLKVYFKTSGLIIQQHFVNGTLGAYIPVNLLGAVNEVISLNITGSNPADQWYVIINYAVV